MKAVTLNTQYDDCLQTEILFVFSDMNKVCDKYFLEKNKNHIKKNINSGYFHEVEDETIEQYTKEVLNCLKDGKTMISVSKYVYLDFEEVEFLG